VTDAEGFLENLADWNPEVAQQLAAQINLTLTDEHWELIELAREFYATTDVVLVVREQLGQDKGTSMHLNLLFPDGAAKNLARVAGLPKPTNCL